MRLYSIVFVVLAAVWAGGQRASAQSATAPDVDISMALPTTIEGRPLEVYFAAREGKVVAGGAHGYNTALHTIDGSGLTVTAEAVKGPLKITIAPDAYLPKDKKPVLLEYTIDAAFAKRALTGTYTATVDGKEVKTEFTGRSYPPADKIQRTQVSMIMWGAIAEGAPHLRDAQLDFALVENLASRGRLAWRKKDRFHWTAVVDSVEAKIVGSKLTATVESKVTSGGEVKGGSYTFKLEGHVIANYLGGKVKVILDGQDRKEVHFTGKLVDPSYGQ